MYLAIVIYDLRRQNKIEKSYKIIEKISEDMDIIENMSYHQTSLFHKSKGIKDNTFITKKIIKFTGNLFLCLYCRRINFLEIKWKTQLASC